MMNIYYLLGSLNFIEDEKAPIRSRNGFARRLQQQSWCTGDRFDQGESYGFFCRHDAADPESLSHFVFVEFCDG